MILARIKAAPAVLGAAGFVRLGMWNAVLTPRGIVRRAVFAGGLLLMAALTGSCASGPDPITQLSIPAVIVTRKDPLDGGVTVYLDGKSQGRIPPAGRWAKKLYNAVHTVSVEYRGMRSRQLNFVIRNSRVEFDIWAFENTEPTIQQRGAVSRY
jgi:hypothetical protein